MHKWPESIKTVYLFSATSFYWRAWGTHEDEGGVAALLLIVEIHAEEAGDDGDERHGEHGGRQQQLQLDQLVSVAVQLDVDVILKRNMARGYRCQYRMPSILQMQDGKGAVPAGS